jgi:hypothetical protein
MCAQKVDHDLIQRLAANVWRPIQQQMLVTSALRVKRRGPDPWVHRWHLESLSEAYVPLWTSDAAENL